MNSRKRKKISPASYKKRTYRQAVASANDLVSHFIRVKETDLHILAQRDIEEKAYNSVHRYRNQLEGYIDRHPGFISSLVPLKPDALAPSIVKEMLHAGMAAGVGPMAAVAGVMAEYVGKDLLAGGEQEVIVENGGDIFLKRLGGAVTAIFAGESPLSGKVGIRISAAMMPLGVCTSSGTVGHSLSLGEADSVTVLAPSTALADAAATRLGNEVATGGGDNMSRALEIAKSISGLTGTVIICGDQLGAWGKVDLVKLG